MATNIWNEGFLVDPVTFALIVTSDTTGATWSSGFLRSPTGALVVVNG